MTTKEYFEKRALLTEKYSKERGEEYLKDLEKAYILLDKQIKDDIKKFYKKYSDSIETVDGSALHKALDKDDIKDYNKDIDSILSQSSLSEEDKKILRDNYIKYKLSRLESLKKQIELRLKILTREYELSSVEHLKENYKEVYAQNSYDLAVVSNIDIIASFKTFDDRLIEKIVKEKWSNKAYSSRIWGHYRKTAKEIRDVLTSGMGLGYSVDKMSKRLEDRTKVSFSNCKRLIRTESNRMLSEATNDLYKDAGLEKYQFLATLDYKTSEICQSLDNKIFNVKDRKVGENSNPMHPNCRSTTVAYFKEYEDDEEVRIARDPITGKSYYVPAKHNYTKWYESLTDEQKNAFKINKIKWKNKSNDIKQLNKYTDILGSNTPKTIDEFQEIKYNDSEKWERLKLSYKDENLKINIREKYNLKINQGQQDKHIIGTNNYNQELIKGIRKSYLLDGVDPQKLVNMYAGMGEIRRDRNGKWIGKQMFEHTDYIGYVFYKGHWVITKYFSIEYSKKYGTHIVPRIERQ